VKYFKEENIETVKFVRLEDLLLNSDSISDTIQDIMSDSDIAYGSNIHSMLCAGVVKEVIKTDCRSKILSLKEEYKNLINILDELGKSDILIDVEPVL
jgi:hypothetical protein